MEQGMASGGVDLEKRLRRSKGRSERKFVASAKVTLAEQREIEAAAGANGKALSEWAREALLREARRPIDDPLMTEVTAIRMVLMLLLKPLLLKQAVTPEWIADALATVRRDKRKATQDVMQQYRDDAAGGR